MLVALLLAAAFPSQRIAVLEIRPKLGVAQELADALTDEVVVQVRKRRPNAKTVGPDDIKSMIGFQRDKAQLGCDTAACLTEIGGALGADYLVAGTLARFGDVQLFTLKLIEVRKAEVLKEVSDQLAGHGGAELLSGADRLVLALLGEPAAPAKTLAVAPVSTAAKSCSDPTSCEKSCMAKDANACARLGYFYERGTGVTKDLARAVDLYQRSCSASDPLGCCSLGFSYESGTGVPVDLVKAAELFRRSCDAGAALGCGKLGEAYELGRGLGVDAAKAVAFYRKGCDGNVKSACDSLHRMGVETR